MRNAIPAVRRVQVIIDVISIVIFSTLFLNAPSGFSQIIAWTCISIFGLYAIPFMLFSTVVFRNKPVILTTQLCFSLFYYVLFFHPYLMDLLGLSDYRLNRFLNFTFPSEANKGLLLAVVGYVAFCLGLRFKGMSDDRFSIARERVTSQAIFDKLFPILFVLIISFYNLSGLAAADISRYKGGFEGGAVADGVYVIIIMLCVLGLSRIVATLTHERRLRFEHWLVFVLIFYWSLKILIAGDRNNFMIIALSGFGGVAAFLVRVRFPAIIIGTMFALTVYSTFEAFRVMPDASLSAFLEAFNASRSKEDDSNSFGITTAVYRATFAITPDQVPYGYGFYKLVGILGIVPFIRGYLFEGVTFTTSADALAFFTIGADAGWGVGSNIISDIYMDFGLIGVPVLMAAIGFAISSVQSAITSRGATAKLIFTYMILFGTIAEIPRYSFDFPIRMLVWGLIILLVYEFIFIRIGKK